MRAAGLIATSALLLGACGSPPSSGTDSVATVPPPTTPVTKVPRTTVPGTDLAPPTTVEPGTNPNVRRPGDVPVIVPTTTTRPPPPASDPPIEPTGTAELLLDADELPAGWELDGVDSYRQGSGGEPFDACPPARSIEIVDPFLEWEATYTTPTGREALELIGEYESAAGAVDLVEMFAQIADCDLDELFEEADWSGGLEEVASADRAARLTAEIPDEGFGGRFDLMLMAVDSIVMVISHEGPTGDDGVAFYDLAERAAGKAAAG